MRLIIILLSLAVSACATPPQYIKTTGKFAAAVPPVADAYRDYITHIYYLDADTHLRLVAIDPTMQVTTKEIKKTSFSPEALEARLEATETLVLYSQALASAANLDLGENFTKEARAAGTAFSELETKIKGFAAVGKDDVPDISTPVSKIVAIIGKSIIEKKQANAIRNSILDAEVAVSELITAMEEDLEFGTLLTVPNGPLRISTAANAYNARIGTKGFAGKAQENALRLVKEEFENYKNTRNLNNQLAKLFTSLKKANKALVRHAKVEGEENKLAALNDALASVERLSSRAEDIRKAIKELKS